MHDLGNGDREAEARLLDLVYHDLKRIAANYMRQERRDHTLQPTALVSEAYVKLIAGGPVDWKDRGHFFATAARVMRRILVDHAREHLAKKRGEGKVHLRLDEVFIFSDERSRDLLALEDALTTLGEIDPRQCRVVEMRFFAGMTEQEIGAVLGISDRTVKREWDHAKTWLYGELSK